MSRLSQPLFALSLTCLVACDSTESGFRPVGKLGTSPLAEERFVRRLYVDLTGLSPTDAELEAGLIQIRSEQGSSARASLANELMGRPAFADLTFSELEIDAFGGSSLSDVFALICPGLLVGDPACAHCDIQYEDPCSCDCPSVRALATERQSLMKAPADLMGGTSTQEIEHRVARTDVFRFNGGSSEGVADLLFSAFLGRPAENEEIKNVSVCVLASGVSGMGCIIFHQLAHSFEELVDHVFASEVYKEAVVRRTFLRYLGREPSPTELGHFVSGFGQPPADSRPIIVSIVSSAEYFSQ